MDYLVIPVTNKESEVIDVEHSPGRTLTSEISEDNTDK